MSNRRRYNFRILKLLFLLFCKYPELRFAQVMNNLDFYEESEVTYKRLKDYYNKVGGQDG